MESPRCRGVRLVAGLHSSPLRAGARPSRRGARTRKSSSGRLALRRGLTPDHEGGRRRRRDKDGEAGAEEVSNFLLCNIDYEHTQSTKAGAPGVDPGQLITEGLLFPQRQTDVATDAPRRDREVNADHVLFGGERRLKCSLGDPR